MASINIVYSVMMDNLDPYARIFKCNITDYTGDTYDCVYCTRPANERPPSMNAMFQEWLRQNPHVEVLPFTDPYRSEPE